MINVTTNGVKRAMFERVRPQIIARIGARAFWSLLALELVLLLAALFWVLEISPTRMPVAATGDLIPVRDAVWSRLTGSTNDPLIEVRPGVSVRESNVRGFNLNGTVYYYYVEGNQNFDPLSRGDVATDKIEILLRDESGPLPLVIYTIHA